MALSFDQLKAACTLKTIEVSVPEFGGSLKLRQLDGRRGLEIGRRASKASDDDAAAMATMYVDLISASVVDDAGTFILDSAEGREIVSQWPFAALQGVGSEALELNNMGAKKND